MKASEYLGDREHLYDLLSEMNHAQWDKLLDLLRVISFAKLPDSRLKAADDISCLLWSIAEHEEEEDMYRTQTLEQIYGFANAQQRRCEV